MYLALAVSRALQTNPNGIATIFRGRARTWREFAHRVRSFANALHRLGIRKQDRVAVLSTNSDTYIECYFAAAWAGVIITPLNFRWANVELSYALKESGAKALIFQPEFAEQVIAIKPELDDLDILIQCDEPQASIPGAHSYEALVDGSTATAAVERAPQDPFAIFYTGGTTGFPKGVTLSTIGLWANVMYLVAAANLDKSSVFLHTAPSFHLGDAAWCMAITSVAGSHVVLPAFDTTKVIRAIAEHRVTCILLVPTMFKALLDDPDIQEADLSSLRTIVYGTAPMAESVLKKGMELLPQVNFIQMFGQTELSAVATILPPTDHLLSEGDSNKLRSVGQCVVGAEIRILNDKGDVMPTGETGEVVVRSPGNMLGYWNNPEQTAKTLKNGWVHMGDAGYLDEDGYLYVVDRLKDMIISGGENVFSVEVENAIMRHPRVQSCAVIGVPDDKWGERVHAVVVTIDRNGLAHEDLYAHCKELIAGYKCPRSLDVVSEMPVSAAGKILKHKLREPYWKTQSKQVN